MASNRHLGRIIALQTLYERDFRADAGDDSETIDVILTRNLDRYADKIDDKDFVKNLAHGVAKSAKNLDAEIAPIAPEWPLNQIALVDLEILRMAIFELKNFADIVPPKVAINEAVDLAKAFGAENSSRFINGVLGTFWRQLNKETVKNDAKNPENEKTKSENPENPEKAKKSTKNDKASKSAETESKNNDKKK